MTPKPDKTAADYMAIAICPAMIMVLVGSLVFFLVQIGYTGAWLGRLRWTLFWFVFAMVLVSRIAIQQSPGAAFLYGLALALATSLMLTQYLGFLWGVWLLLALIWWTSNKIVWDCTFIDDDQDASGQGLLQVSRFDRWTRSQLAKVHAVPEPSSNSGRPGPQEMRNAECGMRNAGSSGNSAIRNAQSGNAPLHPALRSPRSAVHAPRSRRLQDVHAPGLWVLYFSFAAVPFFGLGELLLDSRDSDGRSFCFVLLLVYLAAALGLLLLTSFLGLRRYLRQRYLVMPMAMAGSWMSTGLALVLGVLSLALLLPRPATPYSLAAFVMKLGSPTQQASQRAPETSGGAEGQSHSQSRRGQNRPAPENAPNNEGQTSAAETAGKAESASGSTRSGASVLPKAPSLAIHVETWLSYLAVGVLVLAAVCRFWPEISAGMRSFLETLASFWAARRPKKPARKRWTPRSPDQPEPVALWPNPFQTGQAERMSLADLVQYSYDGLMVWAQSRGFTPNESETPLELAERLSEKEPALTSEILLLSSYYSHLAYAGQSPTDECRVVLRRLWSIIRP